MINCFFAVRSRLSSRATCTAVKYFLFHTFAIRRFRRESCLVNIGMLAFCQTYVKSLTTNLQMSLTEGLTLEDEGMFLRVGLYNY